MKRSVKFEVQLNGAMLCRAGAMGIYRYLCAELCRKVTRTNYNRVTSSCQLGVAGSTRANFMYDERLVWLLTDLKIGDEIRIRLVEEGELTQPIDTAESNECRESKIIDFSSRRAQPSKQE